MNKYHCTVKVGPTPARALITAKDVGEALEKMCKIFYIANTSEIDEYEILEVVGKDAYKKVASKGEGDSKPRIKLPLPPPPKENDEVVYESYTLGVAK